jgi:hypothetical protein
MKTPSASRRASLAARALICCLAALPPAAVADSPPSQTGELEYFFNADPGPGNGTVLAVSGNSLAFSADTAGLSPGTHKLYLRTRPNGGEWGPPFPMMVTIEPSSDRESVAAWEFSVGTPAPPGTGIALPSPAGKASTAKLQATLALEDKIGTAMVYLRAKDSAGVWGAPFPMMVAIEGSSEGDVPATLQYAWLSAGTPPAWQAIALPAAGGATVSHSFQPSFAGMSLGTHSLAIRSLDGSGSAGVPFLMPLAVVPDSLTGHPPAADRLVAYATNANGVIAGSRVEIPLGINPQPHHSLHLALGGAATGSTEAVAYVTSVTGEASPLANAFFSIVADGTNGYETWRTGGGRFSEGELSDPLISGMQADPDKDGITNVMEFASGSNPRQRDGDIMPRSYREDGRLVFQFRQIRGGEGHRTHNYTASGVRYAVQYSYKLTGDWATGGHEAFEILGITDNGDGSDTIRVTPTAAITSGRDALFLRLMVNLL